MIGGQRKEGDFLIFISFEFMNPVNALTIIN